MDSQTKQGCIQLPSVQFKREINLKELATLIERGSIDVMTYDTYKGDIHYSTYYNQERKRLMVINEIREINYRIKRAKSGFGYYDNSKTELMKDASFSEYIQNLKEYKKELYRYLQKIHDSKIIDPLIGDSPKEKLYKMTKQVSMYID